MQRRYIRVSFAIVLLTKQSHSLHCALHEFCPLAFLERNALPARIHTDAENIIQKCSDSPREKKLRAIKSKSRSHTTLSELESPFGKSVPRIVTRCRRRGREPPPRARGAQARQPSEGAGQRTPVVGLTSRASRGRRRNAPGASRSPRCSRSRVQPRRPRPVQKVSHN